MSASNPPKERKNILLPDDDEYLRGMTAACLRFSGYDVTEVGSAEEALALYLESLRDTTKRQIYGVLTDHNMGDMSGTELIGKIHEIAPGLPVLVHTGNPHEPPEVAKKNGIPVPPILAKPYTAGELIAKAREVFGA